MAILRRDLCKTLLAAPFALQAKDPPPNILFILSDDHSYPYLGVYGATWMSTPNLDQFARECMLMDISSQGPTPQLFDQFLGKVPEGHDRWDRDAGHVDPAKIKLRPHLRTCPASVTTSRAIAAKSSAPTAPAPTPWRPCERSPITISCLRS